MEKAKKIGQFPNTMVVLSLTIALFLVGICGLISFKAKRLATYIKQNVEVQVYLEQNIGKNTIDSLRRVLTKKEYVLKNDLLQPTIEYISKDSAANLYIAETKENFTDILNSNPLHDSFKIKIAEGWFTDEKLLQIKKQLLKVKGVYEVSYVENLAEEINKNIAKVYLVLSGFVILLLITIIVLINNTIKLAVFSQRFLIRSMQLVGATDSFIYKPFITRAGVQGFVSGCIAIILVLIIHTLANASIPELDRLSSWVELTILGLVLVVLGVGIAISCTFSSIYKNLRLSLDQLYH